MLDLPGVTLCCIDNANHALAARALRRSAIGITFARSLFLTDRRVDEPGIEVRTIAPLASRDDYSRFVLASLLDHVDTPHVLLVQWDGYALNAAGWRGDFLDCDYIGAKWFWAPEGQRVGNGGFSLRSRRLLEALRDPRIVLTEAEDVTIGRTFRTLLEREHAIRYATESQADQFVFGAAPDRPAVRISRPVQLLPRRSQGRISALVMPHSGDRASLQLAQLGRIAWRSASGAPPPRFRAF
jgi:hypothetical protein